MKILVIRRDNIGDLVCTTPLLSLLAEKIPDAEIDVLVNEYNYQVLEGNPDIKKLWVYRKAKHRKLGEGFLGPWLSSFRLILEIRKQKYDYVVIASPGFQASAQRLAKYSGGKTIIGYQHTGSCVDQGLPSELSKIGHEVEATSRLATLLCLDVSSPPALKVIPSMLLRDRFIEQLSKFDGPTVALHISARKTSQRWPAKNFAELARELCASYGARVLLFWSPGLENDPLHPGDDAKAEIILKDCADISVLPVPTTNLRELIAALSIADSYIGSDGGAMHLAAGLGLPIVAMFGTSDSARWRPWSKRALCLQAASQQVSDLTVQDLVSAWTKQQKSNDCEN